MIGIVDQFVIHKMQKKCSLGISPGSVSNKKKNWLLLTFGKGPLKTRKGPYGFELDIPIGAKNVNLAFSFAYFEYF